MARSTSEKVGRGPCPSCSKEVTFRRSSGGMLTHRCDCCDSSGYAEPGGQAFRDRMASLTERFGQEPAAEPAATPAAEPANTKTEPAAKPAKAARSVFDLGQL